MRAFDWSQTALGPTAQWPQNLRVAVGVCLASRFPMHLWWGPGLTLLYNDAYIPFLGRVKHPGALGRPGHEAWPEIWGTIGPMIEQVREAGQASWAEDTRMFFDRVLPREEVYVTFSFSPVLGEGGHVDGLFCACTETTEKLVGNRRLDTLRKLGVRATVAQTIEQACAAAAAVLGENPYDIPFAAIYVIDEAGGTARLNASAGLSADGPGLPPSVSLGQNDPPPIWPLAQVLRTNGVAEVDVPDAAGLHLAAGSAGRALVLPVRVANGGSPSALLVAGVSPHRPLDDAYRGFFELVAGHIGDAMADARAHEAERRRAEALVELDRAKTAFFSNVSHELRTPLTLLLGPLEEALSSRRLAPEDQTALEVVHRSGLRLVKLVNSLLDFSRIEANRIQLVYRPTDLARFTAELANAFRSAIERADLRYTVDCRPLPEAAYVDRDMWEKIVLNLVSNAFKFTFKGAIGVRLRGVDGCAELTVRDTGAGIPASELPRVFERFHRVAGSTSRTADGAGIGLAMVKELVKLHGGRVSVESEVGRGTTFRVTVPLGRAHLPEARIGGPLPGDDVHLDEVEPGAAPPHDGALPALPDDRDTPVPGAAEEGRARDARILLADDDPDMRGYVRRLLGRRWTVETVGDGLAALAAARARVPDLVLADVAIPGLDGLQLLRELRRDARTRGVPVILVSPRALEESKIEGLGAGADDYLVKPFSARELLARVNAHLTLARVRARATAAEVARTRAEAASHAKDEFLAMLGHELRNPLFAISAASELLDITSPPQAQLAHDIIRHEVRHLARLVDDLLDAGRVAMGKIKLNRRPLNLSAAVERLVATLRAAVEPTHDVRLDAQPVWIDGDETRIEQMVDNLLGNAMKFTPRGGRVAVTVRPEGLDAVIRVEDDGIGIPAETLPRIFELFVQGDGALDQAKSGLGIGLTLVKRIAKLHGGTVQATSPGRGGGSVFTVRLPRIGEPARAPEAARPGRAVVPRRVLVVEDNANARKALALVLSLDGCEVHEASDGPSGVEAALRLCPDVVLIDIGLPGFDGYRVAEQIRAGGGRPDMRLVALTGYGQARDRERALRAGFDAHLVKPVDRAQIEQVLGGVEAPRGEPDR